MTTDKYHTEIRKQLIAGGYEILPNKNKMTLLKGWNAAQYADTGLVRGSVDRWEIRFPLWEATGVRVRFLRVIDIDIDHELIDDVHAAIRAIAPQVWEKAPARYGKSAFKCALFCGLPEGDEAFTTLRSRRWFAGTQGEWDAAGGAGGTHMVEIFGGGETRNGKVSRQVGAYGPHSHNADGSIAADYAWADTAAPLHEVPRVSLPMLTIAQARAIINAVDALCAKEGWYAVPETKVVGDGARASYDITDETRFNTNRGHVSLTYEELSDLYEDGADLRVAALFQGEGTNTSRCKVGMSKRHGCVVVHDFETDVTHYPEQHAPRLERLAIDVAKLTATVKEGPLPPDAPAAPAEDATNFDKALWLLQTHAYYAVEDRIVRLHEAGPDCRYSPQAFQRLYAGWCEGTGRKRIEATELWLRTQARLNVEGVRMRPDRPFPVYEEDGRLFKNTYQRPEHEAGGELGPFLAFMDRFLPDAFDRGYMLDWMAHKWRKPEVPSIALIFVAETDAGVREESFGTGRGLLANVAHALYGPQYSRPQMFSVLDGTSGQSAYTDWLHGSVLVTIDEGKSSPTSYRRGERSATYEILKNIVDPAPKAHRFTVKYGAAFEGMSYCSLWLATNHADAIAIPAHDRRFAVLRNGRPVLPEEAAAFVAWSKAPGSLGALAAFLEARDLSGFNPFAAPQTATKAEMAAHAIGEVEEIMAGLRDEKGRGVVFTRKQVADVVSRSASNPHWGGEFAAAWARYCVGVRNAHGGPRRVRVAGVQTKLYCFRGREGETTALPEAALGRQAGLWGPGVETQKQGLSVLSGLTSGLTEKPDE